MDEVKIGMIGSVDTGKCEKSNTPIIMYDGTIKMIQDIKIGDLLMGDDSTHRTVLNTISGTGKMYDIKSRKFDTYTVTENHILSLKVDNIDPKYSWLEYLKNKAIICNEYLEIGDIIDISVKDFLNLPKELKRNLKGYKVGINFEEKDINIESYILGYWLGKGDKGSTKITTTDKEIVEYFSKYAKSLDMVFKIVGKSKHIYNMSTRSKIGGSNKNKFMNWLRKYNLIHNKHIPYNYKCNSYENRMKLLAGLIDSNGHYNKNSNTILITSKYKTLAYDIYFLAGSLGLGTIIKKCIKTCTNSKNSLIKYEYYKIQISGKGQENIPTILERKKIRPFNDYKNPLVYNLHITESKETKYFGFELDGNGRYLHNDFVVTHNSSTTSVLINNILDNGRGSARCKIMKHNHELETGRTSCITENYLKIEDKNKYISFVDLAGHEKYLKTTISGLSGHYIDYAMIFVGANMGVSKMTIEHLILSITLKIPFIIVVSKIDIAPENIFKETVDDIINVIKKMRIKQKMPVIIDNCEKINKINLDTMFPIFCTSNKTGDGIDKLREYIINLSPRYDWHKNNNKTIFSINHKYNVKGIGTVFSGKLTNGKLTKNDKLYIGPFNGKWVNIIAKSIHDNFRNNINELNAGESGCIAINSKKDFSKSKLKRGIILIDKIDNIDNVINHFDAEVVILTKHSTTMKKGYSPIINCNTVSQTAKIVDIYDKEVLRCGDKCKVKFEFLFRPEYIKEDEHFVFRDGKTKGFGKIIKIY